MVDFKETDIKKFYKNRQPNCSYKRLLPCIINGYSLKVFVCSRTDKKCTLKNCPEYGKV